ncbi:hypothetical protein SMALB_0005 [Streptomyces malaysiensis]|uniref:Uncharacterized protein n=1 Tax=Streptomyces malaysiensis TaxID=92644 RepID=A0A7X5WW89_STRMQ|nr:hypothetical protein [Streptomyces malaysiensis]
MTGRTTDELLPQRISVLRSTDLVQQTADQHLERAQTEADVSGELLRRRAVEVAKQQPALGVTAQLTQCPPQNVFTNAAADRVVIRAVQTPLHRTAPSPPAAAPLAAWSSATAAGTAARRSRGQQTRQRMTTGPHQARQVLTAGPLHGPSRNTSMNDDGHHRDHYQHHRAERNSQQGHPHVHLTTSPVRTRAPDTSCQGLSDPVNKKPRRSGVSAARHTDARPGPKVQQQKQQQAPPPPNCAFSQLRAAIDLASQRSTFVTAARRSSETAQHHARYPTSTRATACGPPPPTPCPRHTSPLP